MSHKCPVDLIVITGPTATGKTRLAALVADYYDGEIISADSRQVYKDMDLGTGKDYNDYVVNGKKTPYHLIDIRDAGYEYNVYEFQNDFLDAFEKINAQNKQAVLCGGTGLYVESAICGRRIIEVPEDPDLRAQAKKLSYKELIEMLGSLENLHNTTDTSDYNRLVRAIEIEKHKAENKELINDFPEFSFSIFAIYFERNKLRERITKRLHERLNNGMLEEVQKLLDSGIKPEQLKYYGLEYRFLTEHLTGELEYDKMVEMLNTVIHQFAKRQMTWFRRMEKQGYKIQWIQGENNEKDKLNEIISTIEHLTVKQKTK